MDQRGADAGPMRILEVGAGSGSFTTEILRKLRPNDVFDVVELDEGFCKLLQEQCAGKSNVTVHQKSILEFNADKYDLIVSGIPIHGLDMPDFVRDLYPKYLSLAKEGAVISQFEYIALPKIGSWVFCGQKRRNLSAILRHKEQFRQNNPPRIAPVYWN